MIIALSLFERQGENTRGSYFYESCRDPIQSYGRNEERPVIRRMKRAAQTQKDYRHFKHRKGRL